MFLLSKFNSLGPYPKRYNFILLQGFKYVSIYGVKEFIVIPCLGTSPVLLFLSSLKVKAFLSEEDSHSLSQLYCFTFITFNTSFLILLFFHVLTTHEIYLHSMSPNIILTLKSLLGNSQSSWRSKRISSQFNHSDNLTQKNHGGSNFE